MPVLVICGSPTISVLDFAAVGGVTDQLLLEKVMPLLLGTLLLPTIMLFRI